MNKEIPKCISVANRIINRTNAQNDWRYELGKPTVMLSVKRIQKIMYLCQLFAFIENTESNMIPEDFVAWANGPAVPELYDYWLVSHEGYMNPYPNTKYQLSEEEKEIINIVVDNTIDIHTETIIDFIQNSQVPWKETFKTPFSPYSVISKESIKQFISKEESQIELFEFIKKEKDKQEKDKQEKEEFTKKLTPPRNTGNK